MTAKDPVRSPTKTSPLAVFTGIGFEIVALIIVAVFTGGYIDRHFDLKGIGTVVMIILATLAWMFHVFILLKKLNQSTSHSQPDEK